MNLFYVSCYLQVFCAVFTSASLIVNTTGGAVEGFRFMAKNKAMIDAWRGIRYALPPVADRRWRPPVPASTESWTEVRPATDFGSVCVQPEGRGSEDCLFLNVYAPSASRNQTELRPVLFYIHGGSLTSGDGQYDMTGFLSPHSSGVSNSDSGSDSDSDSSDVLLVEINYRLNMFGFLATREIAATTNALNYGLLDQILALQWTRDNIRSFGGDPSRVTIMGQSSGGTSVLALLSSPLSRGLFAAGVSLSGSTNISMTPEQAFDQNDAITTAAGCSTTGGADEVAACMRALSVAQLVTLIPDSWGTPGLWDLPGADNQQGGQGYAGLLVVDGVSITHSMDSALSAGVIDVPLLLSSMGQESNLYPERDVSAFSLQQWKQLLESNFASWNGPKGADGSVGEALFELYAAHARDSPQLAFDSLVTDYGITCASIDILRNLLLSTRTDQGAINASPTRRAPLYVLVNQWPLASPYRTPMNGGLFEVAYAFHQLDLFAFTDNWESVNGPGNYDPQAVDWHMLRVLQQMFREFIVSSGAGMSAAGFLPSYPNTDSDEAAGSSGTYSVFVLENPYSNASETSTLTLPAGRMTQDYKRDICDYFHGIFVEDRAFWWVN